MLFGSKLKFVFMGPISVPRDPKDSALNRARRGEWGNDLTLIEIAQLAVATETGEDYGRVRVAEQIISGWVGAGLIAQKREGDKDVFSRKAVLAVQIRLEKAGLWSDALALWCGAAEAGGEWVSREQATERAIDAELCKPHSDPLKNDPKWAIVFKRTEGGRVKYEWGGLSQAWSGRVSGSPRGSRAPALAVVPPSKPKSANG